MGKYFTIFKVSMKNSTTYLRDFVLGNSFIVIIIIIFVLLWKNLYSQQVNPGFTYEELIWYLIINQIVFSNNMELFRKIENEIKSGSIAYHLNKPYSYPAFVLFDALGKNLLGFVINLCFGFAIGMITVGPLPVFKLHTLPFMLIMMLLGMVLNLLIYILLSLTSFWFEENKPFVWIYRQIVFSFGGFLLPITLFPSILYKITLHMPWSYIAFHTSKSCVKFTYSAFFTTAGVEIFYILFFSVVVALVYRKGATRLNVNGG